MEKKSYGSQMVRDKCVLYFTFMNQILIEIFINQLTQQFKKLAPFTIPNPIILSYIRAKRAKYTFIFYSNSISVV